MRYLRLFAHFFRFSLSKALEFRLDFTFRIGMDVILYIVNILFFKILYLHTNTIGGFTEGQAMVFVASYLLKDSIMMSFLGNNLWYFPIFVNQGDLDYYLVRPVSEKFFLSLRDMAANSMINMFLGIALLIWAISNLQEPITLSNFLLYLLFCANGLFLYYLLRMLMIMPVFWVQSGRGLDEIFWSLEQIMERPDAIFTGIVRKALISFLPLALIVSYPVRILFEGPRLELIVPMVLATFAFVLVFHFSWKWAMRNYGSASS